MAKQSIYTVGGTVQAGGGIYIKRKADDALLELCRRGELAFILSSRQVGKSSLMARTAEQLAHENIRSSMIDLSSLGTQITVNEWYLGILNIIATDLNLTTDIFTWWAQYQGLSPAQRFFNFLRDVMLKEVGECVVLFFDEIDTTLSLDFADDFFTTLRAIYNARSNTPDFRRLSFVLVGVATPGDLISDSKRTPFNIGRRVEISDFTLAEALPLAQGLGEQAVQVLTWIFQYTNGHPYLTQRLCAYLASSPGPITEQDVERAVKQLFTGEQGKQDNNIQFVRDMLSKRSPDVAKVLSHYKDVRSGKRVLDDERSIAKAHLKLSGLVRTEQGFLRVRNEIYNVVFDNHWVQENTPKNWQRVALIALSTILGILIVGTLFIFIHDYDVGTTVTENSLVFISPSPPEKRLHALAAIYNHNGYLFNKDSRLKASELFYGLSSKEEQEAIFRIVNPDSKSQSDLLIVIKNLYITVANVDPYADNTVLLQTMYDALGNITDSNYRDSALKIRSEIEAWSTARANYIDNDYESAVNNYSTAIARSDPQNPATLYERAKVYLTVTKYANALVDLDSAIKAAKQRAPASSPSTTPETATSTSTPDGITLTSTQMANPLPGTSQPDNTATSNFIVTSETSIVTSPPGLTATLGPSQTATPTIDCSLCCAKTQKYEQNFTTIADILYAVSALFNDAPQLNEVAMQGDVSAYSNLKEYPLIFNQKSTSTATPTATASSLTLTPTPPEQPVTLTPTSTPGVDSTQIAESDGMIQVYVPAGEFQMGSDVGDVDEQPIHSVYLDAFWIDQTEVTNTMYAKCVAAGPCYPPRLQKSNLRDQYYSDSTYDNYPVVYVTWEDANAYCAWVNRRLPTEAEWEKAASRWNESAQQNDPYPWGKQINCTLANYQKSSQEACVNDTAEVNAYPNGASYYGVLNMAGNVWEWVSDFYDVQYYDQNITWQNPQGSSSGISRVFRGGSFKSGAYEIRITNRGFDKPTNALNNLGFRCALTP